VSYTFIVRVEGQDRMGQGMAAILLDKKVDNMPRVVGLANLIAANDGLKNVNINNFQLLKKMTRWGWN
jgi:hypothetical protein